MESIYQSRGFASCLKQSFNLILLNPWRTIKMMGLWALAESVLAIGFAGVYTKVAVDSITGNLNQSSAIEFYGSMLLLLLVIVLGLYAPCHFCKKIVKICDGMNTKEKKKAEAEAQSEERQQIMKPVKVKTSKVILGDFGPFAGIFFMSLFLAVLMSIVPMITCLVAGEAYLSYVEGLYNFHDSVFIPTSGYVWMFILCTVSMTLALLLDLVCPASMAYKYGSVIVNQNNK